MRDGGGGGTTALRRAVANALPRAEPPLEVVAQQILGLAARIDWVARAGDGQVWLVALAAPGEDLARLADLLAQRAWLAPRLPDWEQLAPERRLDAARSPGGLLLAEAFDPRTEVAARSVGDPDLRLARTAHGADGTVQIEPLPAASAAAPRPHSRFRTGLAEADLRSETAADPEGSQDLTRSRDFSPFRDDPG